MEVATRHILIQQKVGNDCEYIFSKRLDGFSGADLGGQGASAPLSKFFYLYVTATINCMKISFNDV